MTGTPKGSTESGFKAKPGIEPATPGSQGKGLSPTQKWVKVQNSKNPELKKLKS